MIKTSKVLIIISFVLFIFLFSVAQELYIFIHNKPYKGKYIYQAGRVYVEVKELVKMTNLKMYNQGNYYVLSNNNIVPPSSFSSLVYFNNRPLKYVILQDSKVFIDLFELASLTGATVEFNKETFIVDYYNKEKVDLVAQEVYKTLQQVYDTNKEIYSKDKKKIEAGQKPSIPKDAIKIIEENPLYEDRNNRGELRYIAKVKNFYKETIYDIKIKIKVVSPANEVLEEKIFTFQSLKPNESKEITLYWINNTTIPYPQVKHEIDFKGKEEGDKWKQ